MTATTDLFLRPSPTAPTGSSGNGASSVDNRPQNTVDNVPDRFKKHLTQETDKKTEEADKQSSGKQVSNTSDTSTSSEGVNKPATDKTEADTYLADNDSAYIQEPENNETDEPVTQPDLNIQPGQSDTSYTASEIPGTTIAPPSQTGQGQDNAASANEKTLVNADRSPQITHSQGQNINGLTNTEKTAPAPQTTDNQNKIPTDTSKAYVSEGEGNIKKTTTEASEVTHISSASTAKQTDVTALSTSPEKQNVTQQNITGQNNTAQNVPVTEKIATTNVTQTPEATSQQMATAGSVIQKDTVNNTASKDSDIKKSDKENNIAAADEKKQAGPKNKSETSSQNSTTDNGSTKTISAQGNTVTNPQISLSAKTPFLSDPGHSMTTPEGKAGQPLTLQLPPGLLSVQEVGQNTSLNASLTATGQIKTPLSSVNPQMITGQIRMAIAKQVDNGQQSFRISLKPAELGQVDIRMDFQAEGRMTATITVDNERTLTLLQRDQSALEKTLENAGFNVGSDDLNFTLKQQQNQGENEFADNEDGEDGENNPMSTLPGSIISQQQMKMAYSDNILDINI